MSGLLDSIFRRAPGYIAAGLAGQNASRELAYKHQQDAQENAIKMALLQHQLNPPEPPADFQIEKDANGRLIRINRRTGEGSPVTAGGQPVTAPMPPLPRDPTQDHAANREFDIAHPLPTAPPGPRNIDPLSPEGIAARLGMEKQLAGFKASEVSQKPPPAAVQKALSSNQAVLGQIDQAIAALQAHPKATGTKFNIARTLLPASLEQGAVDKMDPEGITTRTLVADLASRQIHDRTGAAFSINEAPWMRPFLPQEGRSHEANIKALQSMKQRLQMETDLLAEPYSGGQSGGAGQPQDADALAKQWLEAHRAKKVP